MVSHPNFDIHVACNEHIKGIIWHLNMNFINHWSTINFIVFMIAYLKENKLHGLLRYTEACKAGVCVTGQFWTCRCSNVSETGEPFIYIHPGVIIPPAQRSWRGYTGFTMSICPSVDRIVSALYLLQYLPAMLQYYQNIGDLLNITIKFDWYDSS